MNIIYLIIIILMSISLIFAIISIFMLNKVAKLKGRCATEVIAKISGCTHKINKINSNIKIQTSSFKPKLNYEYENHTYEQKIGLSNIFINNRLLGRGNRYNAISKREYKIFIDNKNPGNGYYMPRSNYLIIGISMSLISVMMFIMEISLICILGLY